jgi:uncharacterized membrane protein SpoIIM required for sporulation
MSFKYLTLSAIAVYLTGVLIGCQIDPDLDIGLLDNPSPILLIDQPKSELLWSIARNNIFMAIINISGGFSLGLISLLNTFYNGVVLGYAFSVALDNFQIEEILKHFLPHAIEIVSIINSCALGLYLGLCLTKKIMLGKNSKFDYRWFIFQSTITLVILVIAAILEVYVSFSG